MAYVNKELRMEIVAEVKEAMRTALQMYQEKWLTADELIEQFGMFNKDWLKRYGQFLPRERVTVTDAEGEEHSTRWAYPRNRIQDMIRRGTLKTLRIPVNS